MSQMTTTAASTTIAEGARLRAVLAGCATDELVAPPARASATDATVIARADHLPARR